MKQAHLKRALSGLMAIVMFILVVASAGIAPTVASDASEQPGAPIHWDFESGELAPFQLVSGSYGTIVSGIPQAHNYPYDPYPRQGDYHLRAYGNERAHQRGKGELSGERVSHRGSFAGFVES